jgi:hypothetical protein
MSKFPTYSMAGIGIAAAIGFVFALSYFNSVGFLDTGDHSPEFASEQSGTEPSSLLIRQKSEDSQGMLANRMETPEATGNETPSTEAERDAGLIMQKAPSFQLTLVSITASNGTNGEIIGDVTPEMEFAVNDPVFIKATLVNPNESLIPGHLVALGISAGNEDTPITRPEESRSYQQASTFHGDISANGSIEVELYWNPTMSGDYALMVFSVSSNDLESNEPIIPIQSIPVRVV